DGAEVRRGRLVPDGLEAGGVRALFETDGSGRGGTHEATIHVDIGAARDAGERDRARTHLALQVGRGVLRVAGTERGGGAGRVVARQVEAHVVSAWCSADAERRVAHEGAVDVDIGAAGVRLECQGAPSRLRCLATHVVKGGIRHPALLRDGVDDDREALSEAFLAYVADSEEVGLVAEAG